MKPASLHVLVVEDDPDVRTALTWFLVGLHHSVDAVGDAKTALDCLHRERFDVLLTDVYLPVTSGWDLLRELRTRGDLPPRIISMSGVLRAEGRAGSQAAGCHIHLVKPFSLSELETALC